MNFKLRASLEKICIATKKCFIQSNRGKCFFTGYIYLLESSKLNMIYSILLKFAHFFFRFDNSKPKDASNDRFILSKGHAAPILYAAHALVGQFPVEDLMQLRKIDSDLEGHPTPRLNFIDVATGSLGQGLSVACGMAYVGKLYLFWITHPTR